MQEDPIRRSIISTLARLTFQLGSAEGFWRRFKKRIGLISGACTLSTYAQGMHLAQAANAVAGIFGTWHGLVQSDWS